MLAFTKRTGYALVAMTHLARLPEGRLASAREIAGRFASPMSLMMNILKDLAAAGFVESVRGAHGGYRLAVRPEKVSLNDVVTALEGPVRLAECMTDSTGKGDQCSCELMARCPITDPVHRVQRKLQDFLSKLTLAEILDPALPMAGSEGITRCR